MTLSLRYIWIFSLGLVLSGCASGLPDRVATMPEVARPDPVAPPAPSFTFPGAARQGALLRARAPKGTQALYLDTRPIDVAPDGAFLVGFDRDAPPTAQLRAILADGREVVQRLSVAAARWDIQSVDASITGGVASAEYMRRRGAELARIAAARAGMKAGSSSGWTQDFVWPVVARISGRFGSQRIYRGTPGSYHGGVDLAAPAGSVYVAPADGIVLLAATAPYTLEGNLLLIDHGMGLNSAFLHSQRLLVKAGDVVRRGQPIGIVGATGRATGPHLHWGMKWGEARIDPVTLVRADPLQAAP